MSKEMQVVQMSEEMVMTSRDIAEITGKNHSDVMRDIRREIEQLAELGESIFALSSYITSQNKEVPQYQFGRDGAMQLALKYDAVTRFKVIKRLNELESMKKPALPASYQIEDPIKRAEAWILEQKEKQQLALENGQMKSKVDYYDKGLDSSSSFTTTDIAKENEMSAIQLNVLLSNNGIQFRQGNRWFLTAKYQDKGLAQNRTHYYVNSKGEEKTKHYLVWTEKGRQFINEFIEGA